MNAQVTLGKTTYTVHGADRLQVDGELVQIQRWGPDGYETIAVAGDDLLVTIEPSEPAKGEDKRAVDPIWHPVGDPLD